ncbi:cation:proton antiporter [Candidatus Uhrbacteria bacterium]|nr:cation:proton antiporter [Candidatus Uhrbacteria bacterium]
MSPFFDIAIVLVVATFFGVIAHGLRQPLIVAYVVAGIVLGPLGANLLRDQSTIATLSTLGIALLLFLIGLDLDLRRLRTMTQSALIIGAGQIIITALMSFGIVRLLAFPPLAALYIALALTFSSTVVAVKLLSEKQDLDAWYARLTIGVLIVQDIIAVLALLLLAGVEQGGLNAWDIATTISWFIFKGVLLFGAFLFSAQTVMGPLLGRAARSSELLTVTSIAWCLLGAIVAALAGFSVAIGAFIAGVALAQLPYRTEIGGRMRALRDFFALLFFVALGAQLTVVPTMHITLLALGLSLFVLIGNPIIVLVITRFLGLKKRIGFFVGLAIAQISEFSLLLMAEGYRLGHVQSSDVLLATLVGLITFPLSSYFIIHAEKLYRWLTPLLKIFERETPHDLRFLPTQKQRPPIVLFGYHRMGTIIAQTLDRARQKTLIVDCNPDVIRALITNKRPCVYGDMSDRELLDDIKLTDATTIVSTVPDFDESTALLGYLTAHAYTGRCIVTALNSADALNLYTIGADYVIFPHALSALHFSALLRDAKLEGRSLGLERTRHIRTLEGMMKKELPY